MPPNSLVRKKASAAHNYALKAVPTGALFLKYRKYEKLFNCFALSARG